MTEAVLAQHPIRQLNDYAISKWVNEQQIMNSADRHATETVRVRLFNTYGPGEYYNEYRSVACQFIYRALHDLPYTVYLNHHRTSSYIDDTVRTLANLADAGRFLAGNVYNIAGAEYHDIKQLSDLVLRLTGRDDSRVQYVEREAHNTLNKRGDLTDASRDLGHVARFDLAAGVPLTIAWRARCTACNDATAKDCGDWDRLCGPAGCAAAGARRPLCGRGGHQRQHCARHQ